MFCTFFECYFQWECSIKVDAQRFAERFRISGLSSTPTNFHFNSEETQINTLHGRVLDIKRSIFYLLSLFIAISMFRFFFLLKHYCFSNLSFSLTVIWYYNANVVINVRFSPFIANYLLEMNCFAFSPSMNGSAAAVIGNPVEANEEIRSESVGNDVNRVPFFHSV